nr:hypothetical protein [Tanacetum cinerariifolium]
ATTNVKNINDEAQLHAKVDGKKVVISEASIRRDIWFRDEGEESQKAKGKRKSRSHGLKRLYKVGLNTSVESSLDKESLVEENSYQQGRISDIDANQDIYLVNVQKDEDIFGVNDQDDTLMFVADIDLQGEEVVVEEVNVASIATATTTTAATTPIISMDEITLAKALIKIKTSRPKAKGLVMQEPSETPRPTPIISSKQPLKVQDKGKRIMVEEPLKMKKKDQILFVEEVARKLQKEIYEVYFVLILLISVLSRLNAFGFTSKLVTAGQSLLELVKLGSQRLEFCEGGVKEMKDVFVSVENDLDETFKQNELLKDRLLKASLAEDIMNLVITSCVEIRNKELHDETDRISNESKDVSNESKIADTVCNDAFE